MIYLPERSSMVVINHH